MTLTLPAALQSLVTDDMAIQQMSVIAAEVNEPARLDACDDSGRVLGSLTVVFTQASTGPGGGIFRAGTDHSGFLYVAMKIRPDRLHGEFDMRSRHRAELQPAEVLPALRFLDAMQRSSQVIVNAGGHAYPARIPPAGFRLAGVQNMLRMVTALDRIGQAVGVVMPLPERWSSEDALKVAFYDRLLAEGEAAFPSLAFTQLMPLDAVRHLLDQGPLPRVSVTGRQNRDAQLLGVKLPLPGRFSFEISRLLITNVIELARTLCLDPPPEYLDVHLVPDQLTVTLFRLE